MVGILGHVFQLVRRLVRGFPSMRASPLSSARVWQRWLITRRSWMMSPIERGVTADIVQEVGVFPVRRSYAGWSDLRKVGNGITCQENEGGYLNAQ